MTRQKTTGEIINETAQNLMAKYVFRTMEDTKEIYYYKDGIFLPNGEVLIEKELEKTDEEIMTGHVNEVINKVKRQTYVRRTEFDKDLRIVNVRNGLLDIETGELSPHTAEYPSLVQLPITYDPKAECPMIQKFLEEVLAPEDVPTAIQVFGYTLDKTTKYQKAILLIGRGANGKSVLLVVLEKLLGKNNVSHASLQEICHDRFAVADLFGKLANIHADLSDEKLNFAGTFKQLVSGEGLRAQRKHQHGFDFDNMAKLVFSANKIPESNDDSYAYSRRWIILPFLKTFEGHNADPTLVDKLTTDDELSGLLNLALKGLRQLRSNGGFTQQEKTIQEIKEQFENTDVRSVMSFIHERCRLDPTSVIPTDELYKEYQEYAIESGAPPLDPIGFGKELKKLQIEKRRMQSGGSRTYYYKGINLSNLVQPLLESRCPT